MTVARWIEPVVLEGERVRLEPLGHEHADDLALACQDGELWKLWYTFAPSRSGSATTSPRRWPAASGASCRSRCATGTAAGWWAVPASSASMNKTAAWSWATPGTPAAASAPA